METVTVYRVEHPVLGCGPWNTHVHESYDRLPCELRHAMHDARAALNDYFWDNEGYASTHPNVRADFPTWKSFYLCATPCLKTLREWFAVESHIVDKLFDAGFTVKQYVVERSAVMRGFSGIQVAFNPDAVVEHNDITLLALLD